VTLRVDFPFAGRVLDLSALSEQAWQTIAAAGVDRAALERVAGRDHVIRGDAELQALQSLLQRADARSAGPELPSVRVGAALEVIAQRPEGMGRRAFVERFMGGGFELRRLSDNQWDELEACGLRRDRLLRLAGADQGIHSQQELSDLFTLLNQLDRDANPRQLELTLGTKETSAGRALTLLEAVLVQRERNFSPDDLSRALLAGEGDGDSVGLLVPAREQLGQKDCLVTAKAMIHSFIPVGMTRRGPRLDELLTTSVDAHYMAKDENRDGQISGYRTDFDAGRRYLDACLLAGRPAIVGVSHSDRDYNNDLFTDHFVVITGRSIDEAGRVFYTFNDPADGSSTGRFYVDDVSGMLFKLARTDIPAGYTTARAYQVTQIRTYSDLPFADAVGRAPTPSS
jgi:hypothetical protein